jgi:hypothetical protein
MIGAAAIIRADEARTTADRFDAGSQEAAGAAAFSMGLARRAPEGLVEVKASGAWYVGYDNAAAKVPGTLQHDAAQRLKLFPLGSRVKVVGYDRRLADAAKLNGRTGRVQRGHFGGLYVHLDGKPRERTEKVELITWQFGQAPTLELVGA